MSSVWTSDTGTALAEVCQVAPSAQRAQLGPVRRMDTGILGKINVLEGTEETKHGETELLTRCGLIKYFSFTCDNACTMTVILDNSAE